MKIEIICNSLKKIYKNKHNLLKKLFYVFKISNLIQKIKNKKNKVLRLYLILTI